MRDLANRALNIAQQLGASYVDVRVMERTTEGIDVKNGRVEGISSGTSSGFNVRVIVEGAWGFASSANMDDVEAARVASQAIQIARASALVAGEPVNLSPLAAQHGYYRSTMPSGRQAGTCGYECIEAMHLADHGERIGEEAVKLLAAPQCPSGVTTIILDVPQTALQVHESCGHSIELALVLGMEAGFVGK